MALGDGRDPSEFLDLLADGEESEECPSYAELTERYTAADEFMDLVSGASSERRTAARIQRVMPAGMALPHSTPIVIIDLSLTGLRIGCVEKLEVHSAIQLDLPLKPEPLSLAGRVCWCKEHVSGNYEVGLRLAPLAGEQMAAYRAFLESQP